MAGFGPNGEAMLANQFHEAVAAVRNTTQLDHVARQLWAAHGQGAIADAEAEAIAGAVQARRAAFARPPSGIAVAQAAPASTRRRPVRPRSPDRQASLERRRRQAASGAVPAKIASSFTQGEIAALAVIARAVQQVGVCILPLDRIAALAGIGRTTCQNAIRLAERLGLILRTERRHAGQKSETNILKITSPLWRAWLQHGQGGSGFKSPSTSVNSSLTRAKNGVIPAPEHAGPWQGMTKNAIRPSIRTTGGGSRHKENLI